MRRRYDDGDKPDYSRFKKFQNDTATTSTYSFYNESGYTDRRPLRSTSSNRSDESTITQTSEEGMCHTYEHLRVMLKQVKKLLRRNFRFCRLKLTLFIIALYSKDSQFMKPFPKYLMKNNKPDVTRAKFLVSNLPELHDLLSSSSVKFSSSINFLYWLFEESIAPNLVQVPVESMIPIFKKINPISTLIRPEIVMRVDDGPDASFNRKNLVYIAVNTNRLHRFLHFGVRGLFDSNQTNICASNNSFINLKIIEKPDNPQLLCTDIDYITLLIAELNLDNKSTEIYHGRLNSHDESYLISNYRALKVKYLLLYKAGTFETYKKIELLNKKKLYEELVNLNGYHRRNFIYTYSGYVLALLCIAMLLWRFE